MENPNALKDFKIMPQNVEAEESLLGALLIDNATLLDVMDQIHPDDFYRTANGIIFDAIRNLTLRNEPADLITVTNYLKHNDKLEAVGGVSYIAHLVDEVPFAVHAPYYAEIIRDKAVLRRLIEKTNAIAKRCYDEDGEVVDVVNFAEEAVFEISERKIGQKFVNIGDLVPVNLEMLEERQKNRSSLTGVPTGFKALNNILSGFQKTDFIILAARPSMGKTALALNFAMAAAKENIGVALFSLEMGAEQLSMRMLCSEAMVNASSLRSGFFSMEDWQKILNAADKFVDMPIYIDDTSTPTIMDVYTKCRRLKLDKNIGLIIIDYIQLMEGNDKIDRHLQIAKISRALKGLAKDLNVPIIALAQLNRSVEQRDNKRPRLSDLRESGALEQDADVVMFIYRDDAYNKLPDNPNKGKAEVIVAKHRNGATGAVGLHFHNIYTRFTDLEPGDAFQPQGGD